MHILVDPPWQVLLGKLLHANVELVLRISEEIVYYLNSRNCPFKTKERYIPEVVYLIRVYGERREYHWPVYTATF